MCGRRGASRFRRHTTRAMEVLSADFAWGVCEVWRAERVIGDRFAAAGCCAGHGVSAAVCDRSAAAVCGTFQMFDLREKFQKKTNSLVESILVVPSQIDSLESVLSLK